MRNTKKTGTAVAASTLSNKSGSSGLPVALQEELARDAATYAANVKTQGESNLLSTRNGVFSFRGESLGSTIQAVIIGAAHVNEFYPDEYDPNVKKTPDCYALSRSGEAMTPHAEAPNKQSTDCASCPNAAIGSDSRRGGRACKQKMRIAIIHGDSLSSEEAVTEADIARIMVPAMSKSKLASYIKVLGENPRYRVPPYAVVTEIKLVPHPKYQYVMEFSPLSIASASLIPTLRARANSEGADSVMEAYPRLTDNGDSKPSAKTAARRNANTSRFKR